MHTPQNKPSSILATPSRRNIENTGRSYYRILCELTNYLYRDTFGEDFIAPDIVFFDDMIPPEVTGEYGVYAAFHRENCTFYYSKNLLGREGTAFEHINSMVGLLMIQSHEFGHAFENQAALALSIQELEEFADTFSGYMTRILESEGILIKEDFPEAIATFERLGEAGQRITTSMEKRDIHGDDASRKEQFLKGLHMEKEEFSRYAGSFSRTRKQIGEVRSVLMQILES